ncbi:putative transcriptional regulator [Mycobacterium sp. JS623]|nr:putative transcriptional regulator [Mycobacterium sp. JS623]
MAGQAIVRVITHGRNTHGLFRHAYIKHGSNKHGYVTLWSISPGPYVVGVMAVERAKDALSETTRAFGERVRDRRMELGLSQEAAAVRCGIHWTQLGKVERGQRSLRLETILKIAAGLDIDAGQLISGLPVPSE